MIDASLPFITQLRYLVSPSELRGLTADLSKTVPALSNLTRASIPLMANGVRPASSCVANVVIPWSKLTINDPNFNASNGFPQRPVYVEAVDFLPGLAGESRDFDANGPYIRILGTGGTLTYSLQPGLFGQALVAAPGRAAAAASGREVAAARAERPVRDPAADHRPVDPDRRPAAAGVHQPVVAGRVAALGLRRRGGDSAGPQARLDVRARPGHGRDAAAQERERHHRQELACSRGNAR